MINFNFPSVAAMSDHFKKIQHGNGNVSRLNNLPLQCLKSRKFNKWMLANDPKSLFKLSASPVENWVEYAWFQLQARRNRSTYAFRVCGRFVGSNSLHLDDNNGICEDGDPRSIRYVNESGRVYKMKAGKFIRRILDEAGILEWLPTQLVVYFCEKFAEEWESINPVKGSYDLVVSDDVEDFKKIYDSNYLIGGFGSCMVDEDNESFYYNSVSARAAYLEDSEGMIAARCIIFDEVVRESDGARLRLAERQYSTGGDLVLQRMLINRLIEAGEIDGYKKVGATCHDPKNWLNIDGSRMDDVKFYIPCSVEYGNRVSYQDSFKWLDMGRGRAYNHSIRGAIELDITGGYLEGEYDEFHDRYCVEVCGVYVYGRYGWERSTCDASDMDEFTEINGDYYETSYLETCDYCGEYIEPDGGYYSDVTECWYCCHDCMVTAESDWYESNGYVKNDFGEWVESPDTA